MQITSNGQIAGYLMVDRAIHHIINSDSVFVFFDEKSAAITLLGGLRSSIAQDMSTDAYLTALTVANIHGEYISTPHGVYA